jgi:hypothetical protein
MESENGPYAKQKHAQFMEKIGFEIFESDKI